MGRSAKSVAVSSGKIGKENIAKRLEAEQKLKGKNDKLEVPDYLTKNQKYIFNFIKDELVNSGILSNLDIYILSNAAIAIDRIRYYETALNKEHKAVDIDIDKVKMLIKFKDSYIKDLKNYESSLCLSPSSRAKLANINVQAESDKEDKLLKILGGA